MVNWALGSTNIPQIATWLVTIAGSWVQSAAGLIMLSMTAPRRL